MKKRILATLLAAMLVFSSFGLAFAEENEEIVNKYSNSMLKRLVNIYAHHIADNYYYGIDDDELLFSIICDTIDNGGFDLNRSIEAMINALPDEHAQFYSPEEYRELTEDIGGEFAGIGVTITQDHNGIVVVSLIDGAPAMRAGIKPRDYIIAVNGTSTVGMTSSEVRSLVTGPIGTSVKISVLRGSETIEVECVREKIEVQHTEKRMVTDDVAYIRLDQFSKNSPTEIKDYVSEIQSKGIKNLILDLRNNPGGDLEAAKQIAEIFISAGTIAELRYKNSEENQFVKSSNYNAPKIKVALLVNEYSASASEFIAMAMQSRGAAKIFGTKTYGKGSMQAVYKLPTGAGMKFTVGEFYSVKGERINTIGVTPDVVIENTAVAVNEDEFEKIDLDNLEEAGKDGKMTLALEQRLEALGAFYREPDEIFDEFTVEAVKKLQRALGYEETGIPAFYEYLYIKDLSYEFEKVVDLQLEEAVKYLNNRWYYAK
ncbi:MAG: S41 family peptidase [Clostridia bacterium]|nr:S41 family peptidase [Clostridia bacterium]